MGDMSLSLFDIDQLGMYTYSRDNYKLPIRSKMFEWDHMDNMVHLIIHPAPSMD